MKRVKVDTYNPAKKTVVKWFKRLRSETVPGSGVLIKEKTYFARY